MRKYLISDGDWPKIEIKGRMRRILVMTATFAGDRRYFWRDYEDEDGDGNEEYTEYTPDIQSTYLRDSEIPRYDMIISEISELPKYPFD